MGRISRTTRWTLAAAVISALAAFVAVGQTAKRIDDNALKNAASNKGEWITYGYDWAETRYIPLDQINDSNVKSLGLSWSFDIPNIGDGNHQESTNLVSNGVMYGITPWSLVYALDLRTHKLKWQSDPKVNQQVVGKNICCGRVNRGLAMYDDKILVPAVDGRMRALKAETGEVVWDVQVATKDLPYTFTMAPRVIKGGIVIIGASGGEYATRGFFAALDVKDGKEKWRFYTTPAPPDKPQEYPIYKEWLKSWDQSFWKHGLGGGGGVWNGMAYDPDTDIFYAASGQPGPWASAHRGPGDNLCTDCIIAVKGQTGEYLWHFQTTPGDDWDFDSIADMTLADLTINGQLRKVLMHAPKNGFLYVLDRVTGKFIQGAPWVTVSWASGLDPVTGRAIVNEAARTNVPCQSISAIPGAGGGHVWQPQSFNPKTGLLYIPSQIGQPGNFPAAATFTPDPNAQNMGTNTGCPGARGGGGGGAPRGGAGGPGGAGAPAGPGFPGAPGRGPGGVPPAAAPPGARLIPGATNAQFQTIAVQTPGGGAPGGGGRGGGAPGGGGGRGGGTPGGGAPRGGAPDGAPVGALGGGAQGGGDRGGGLPRIGPTGNGSMIIAVNPVTMKEAWRGPAGSNNGPFAGGSMATAGNLVFSNSSNNMYVFKADTGEVLLLMNTGFAAGSPGPPMTYMLDGKQYVVIAGGITAAGGRGALRPDDSPLAPQTPQLQNVAFAQGPPAAGAGGGGGGRGGAGGGGGRGGAGGGAPAGPQAPAARLLFLTLDGKPVAGLTSTVPEQ